MVVGERKEGKKTIRSELNKNLGTEIGKIGWIRAKQQIIVAQPDLEK